MLNSEAAFFRNSDSANSTSDFKDFAQYPYYEGNDLGVTVTDSEITVKIWAPEATEVAILIYKECIGGEPVRIDSLNPAGVGCWKINLKGKFSGLYYTLKVKYRKWMNETPGIEAKAVGINGKRGLFFIHEETDPENWNADKSVKLENPVDAVLYEVHVRDFSISPVSGMKYKGKYLAFTEKGTESPGGLATGIDHLKELGITHVHLLPVADFHTVDEKQRPVEQYNWGYDPLNYDTPEGSYSTNPATTARITEFKQLVMALHQAGIGVVLDVVYNHSGHTSRSYFNQTVPGYYYRQNPDGSLSNASGCGNELATERPMVRKFIVDSICYWAKYFHIDGFRFDLMGIIDLETMHAIRYALDSLHPGILLYGEGWTAAASPLDEKYRAVKANITNVADIACFNDDFRDGIKGDNFLSADNGFVNGRKYMEESVKFGIVAACYHPQIVYSYINSIPWANEPNRSVNYVSSHDNLTLFDKLQASVPNANIETLMRMQQLAGALVLTSQGIPFLHAGIEFCRTKYGEHNSYRSPDKINQLDWNLKKEFEQVFNYFRGLISLRKSLPSLRMRYSSDIRKHLFFSQEYQPGVISYYIDDYYEEQKWKTIFLVFNATTDSVEVNLPYQGLWTIIAENNNINVNGVRSLEENRIAVHPISMLVIAFAK